MALRAACWACARHAPADALGAAAARLCVLPYASIVWLAAVCHATRDLRAILFLLGACLNSAAASALKRALAAPRPATCAALGVCHKHGFPSSHSAVMGYALGIAALEFSRRRRRRAGDGAAAAGAHPLVEAAELAALGAAAAAVAAARVYLGYHSSEQAVAGLGLGLFLAFLLHRLVAAAEARGALAAVAAALRPLGLRAPPPPCAPRAKAS
jgi:membrane-associated phospholipid phosphatase